MNCAAVWYNHDLILPEIKIMSDSLFDYLTGQIYETFFKTGGRKIPC